MNDERTLGAAARETFLLDRREMLKTSVLAGAGLALVSSGGVAAALQRSDLAVRRDIGAMTYDDPTAEIYREGVRLMKERSEKDALDPLGWQLQGATHAIFCSDVDVEMQVHYGWFFLPWHRGYMLTLEEKIRRLTGEKDFGLPYWDWTRRPTMPPAFFGGERNALKDGMRLYGPYDVIPADFLRIEPILSAPVFHNFGGLDTTRDGEPKVEGILEQSSHNNVHNWIGGNMANFAGAGFDPIFYTHHNQVDRVWEAWKARDPKANKDPSEREFLDHRFQFYGASGEVEVYRVADLLDPEALGYRFDSLDFADPMTRADAPKPDAGVAPVAVARLNLPAERIAEVRAAGASPSNRRVLLEFERLQVPLHPLCVRVFLNNPEARAETAAVGPTYAGTFTFLPIGTSGRGLEPVVSVQLEVSEALAAVLSGGGDVTVTLAPVPLRGRGIPDVPLQIENVTLTVGA